MSSARSHLAPIAGALLALLALTSTAAHAQDFFGGGAFAFDPEIGIVNSGVIMDAQVVVSHDRRYVTINMYQASQSKLLNLAVFKAQEFGFGAGGGGGGGGAAGAGPMGFVGGAGFIEDEGHTYVDAVANTKPFARGSAPQTPVQTSPAELLKTDTTAANSLLRREGMMLLTRSK